jgi:digeranylgeranylglycerophospholipid reductase
MGDSMKVRCDIIVVGAGPAGALAARYARTRGASVCLLERKPHSSVPVRCGEGIGLKGASLTIEVDPRWILSEVRRIRMVSPDGTEVVVSDVDESYVVDRSIMDAELVEDAVAAGAKLHVNTTVVDARRQDDGHYICQTETQTFAAPCIIICDGVESRVGRLLGWKTQLALDDINSCAFCRVAHDSIQADTIDFYVGSDIAPGGYLWVFPRGEARANVGLGVIGSRSEPGKARRLLKQAVARAFPDASTSHWHCGGVPVARWQRPLVRGGALLAGDAARQVNALTGGGISYALLAGKMAGQAAADALQSGTLNESMLKAYEKQWARVHGRQQLRTYALKSMLLRHFTDRDFNRIARSLAAGDPRKTSYFRVFAVTFARHPLLLPKVFKLFAR